MSGFFSPVFSGFSSELNRPNILFILADDLGYEMLGSYGSLEVETPRLDQLAREGMRFSRAYGSAVCTPTRMSLYTGLYPTRHAHTGVLPVHVGTKRAVDFVDEFPCYAQSMQKAGYLTAVTGKWQLATLEFHPEHIRKAGFETWCVWQIWREGAKTIRFWDPCLNQDGEILTGFESKFGPDVLVDYVVACMRRAKEEERPFFIHHNMLLPHIPIVDTPENREAGESGSLHGMIRYMDYLVGELVDAVDEMGIAEETCIVFLGDNGTDTVGQARQTRDGSVKGGKRTLDDGGTHLPLIVRWKGKVSAESVADDLVDVVDLFPTFCELGGVPLPDGADFDGVSLTGRLLKDEPVGRKVTVAGYQKAFSVFDGDWRLNSDGSLIDARDLPRELILEEKQIVGEAAAARERLLPYLEMAE
ncbi:MAG: sulfatase-like hydrolase/transferase [Verrucomicrobiota bacterium]